MLNFSYHRASLNDISTLVEYRILFALELAGEQDVQAIHVLKNQLTDFFSRTTADNTSISFIAKQQDQIAGIGSVMLREQPGNFKNPSGKWGYIMNMYTVPEFRRNGICKAILNLLVEEAKTYGTTAFELHATKDGEKVYVKDGFIHHNEPTLRKWI